MRKNVERDSGSEFMKNPSYAKNLEIEKNPDYMKDPDYMKNPNRSKSVGQMKYQEIRRTRFARGIEGA